MIMKKEKKIYVPMGADILHSGHLNIIKIAKRYGKGLIAEDIVKGISLALNRLKKWKTY